MSGTEKMQGSATELEGSDAPAQPVISFDAVIAAVEAADGLTDGVRSNIVGAVRRAASLMPGAAGTTGVVNIQALRRKLEKLTPAKLGFKHAGSLSAFRSNLQRALQLAGFTVMPGRHNTKLTPAWAALLDGIKNENGRRSLSRLAHVASNHGWPPNVISDAHIERYRQLVDATCLKSKSKKVVRGTIKAWNVAGQEVPNWPVSRLDEGQSGDWYYGLPWSAFPPPFQADVDAYLTRGQAATDFLDDAEEGLPFIGSRTRENYRDGLKRAASILVGTGVPADTILGIADLVAPERAKAVLNFLRDRLQRNDGGLLGLVAMLLYVAARDWVYPKAQAKSPEARTVGQLAQYFSKTKQKNTSMSEKTQARLSAFNDPRVLTEYLRIPKQLLANASKMAVNEASARQVRLALFIAIGVDTLLRPGNVVSLHLKDQLEDVGTGAQRKIFVSIPKTKNGMAFHGELRSPTVAIFDQFMSKYRSFYAPTSNDWLFPGTNGHHWREGRAYEALNDYCAKHLGIDMTPHVNRSLGGKIILTANPGALFEVQQALLHKRLATTRTHYVPFEMTATQERYHALLAGREKAANSGGRS